MYTVADIMTRELVTLSEADNLAVADSFLELGRIRHLPVTRDGVLVGLVTHRDLLRAAARGADESVPAAAVMTRDVQVVEPGTSLRQAARLMLGHKLGCLPVVEGERLVGLITEADLVRFAVELIEDLDDGLRGLETVQISVEERY